jgi:uncharacterized protein DUF5134
MTGPLWLHAVLASLMIVIAADCGIRRGLVRLGVARRAEGRLRWRWTEFEADCLHVLMGVAMAGMLLPQLRVLPSLVWEAAFGAGVGWFGWRTFVGRKTGSGLPGSRGAPFAHVIECLAMTFMLLPGLDAVGRSRPFGQGMAGMSGSGMSGSDLVSVVPAVALLLALCLVGYVVWTTDGLARARVGGVAGGGSAEGGSAVSGSVVAVAGGVLGLRLAAVSTIAMALTMGYMLIQMA